MNRDPFLRLALIAVCSLYVLALVIVQRWLGFGAMVAVMSGGAVLSLGASTELDRRPTVADPRRRQRQPKDGTEGFERIG